MTLRGYVTGHTDGITPAQYAAMLEGHRFAQWQQLELLAQNAAWILAPWAEKPITGAQLLGKEDKSKERTEAEIEAKRKEYRRLLRKIETAQIARRETVPLFGKGGPGK